MKFFNLDVVFVFKYFLNKIFIEFKIVFTFFVNICIPKLNNLNFFNFFLYKYLTNLKITNLIFLN